MPEPVDRSSVSPVDYLEACGAASRIDAHSGKILAGRNDASAPRATVLAFDFGSRWTGVAVGEHESGIAHPLTVIEAKTSAGRLEAIARLVGEWRPTHLVVGLPLTLEGAEHRLAPTVRRFGGMLAGRFGLPVIFIDERLTSADAESTLRALGQGGRAHKHLAHQAAAQRILQDYFNDGASRR